MKKIVLILAIVLLAYTGCTNMAPEVAPIDEIDGCTPQLPSMNVTYNNYVKSVVTRYCTATCHKGGNSLGPGNFTTYAGIKPYIDNVFYFRVIQDQADMPQGNAPLPKSTRDSLNVWINNCGPQG